MPSYHVWVKSSNSGLVVIQLRSRSWIRRRHLGITPRGNRRMRLCRLTAVREPIRKFKIWPRPSPGHAIFLLSSSSPKHNPIGFTKPYERNSDGCLSRRKTKFPCTQNSGCTPDATSPSPHQKACVAPDVLPETQEAPKIAPWVKPLPPTM